MIDNIIASVNAVIENPFDDIGQLLEWITEVEQDVASNIINNYKETALDLVKDQGVYTLPGFNYEDIEQIIVNGRVYNRGSILEKTDTTYWRSGPQEIEFTPTPYIDKIGGLEIIYNHIPDAITKATKDSYTLLLPKQFKKAYKYYLIAQAYIYYEEYDKANNYVSLFNTTMDEFTKWYFAKASQQYTTY